MPPFFLQVELAQDADVVYSVNEKIHWYYTAKFRNRAQKQIDHRLFLPQASPDVFDIQRSVPSAREQAEEGSQREISTGAAERVILILCSGNPGDGDWEGLDIALCAVNKVAQSHRADDDAYPRIVIGNVNTEARIGELTELVQAVVTEQELRGSVEFHNYTNPDNYYKDLAECSLCIIPSRAEPYGYQGLFALSSGIPTLLASDSALASLIKRLTNEPDQILGKSKKHQWCVSRATRYTIHAV
jgi:glycosyltransferase involved in cell wall biosynthesis